MGYNLKNPGVAHEAKLLVTIGCGGVSSVRRLKHRLHRVIKGMECPFVWVTPFHLGDALLFGQKVLLHDSKKRGWYCTLVEPLSDLG